MISDSNKSKYTVAIVGAGAAGLMAAGSIRGCEVTVFDGNEKAGKKLYITGKGRCNVTNDCTPEDFFRSVVGNPKFLFSAINLFSPKDTVSLLEREGVKTKVERGNRVFPESDKSSDIIKALYLRAVRIGACFRWGEKVTSIEKVGEAFIVKTAENEYSFDKVLIATGGKSYPLTGSTGDGYALARTFGHAIVPVVPSLVPIKLKQDVSYLAGLTLKNVEVRVSIAGKTFSEFGEMLFTHEGVSGPTVLRLSAYINRMNVKGAKLHIDLKPALDSVALDKRITRDFEQNINKQLKNSLDDLLPKALIAPIIGASGIPADKKLNVISKAERAKLVNAVKNFEFDISGMDGFDGAIITAGGVAVSEISPKTMESKLVSGLYFAGEVIDVDALTGGYNIQIALSTAYAAAKAISGGEI